MKLLFCKACTDTFSICVEEERSCKCGKTKGQYIDTLNATYSGDDAIPLGFNNGSFIDALRNQPEEGLGDDFTAFVISKSCETFKKYENFSYLSNELDK